VIWLKAVPWRLVGALVGVGLLAWGALWLAGRVRISYQAEIERDTARAELKTEREQNAANIGAIAQDIADGERDRGALISRLDAIDHRFGSFLVGLPKPEKLIQKVEVPGEPCPRVGLSPASVELWNRSATEAGLAEAEAH
jgi:hypothetical protein